MTTPTLIGQSIARPDARGKVTGATRYPADLVAAGMLHCKIVFADEGGGGHGFNL